MKFEAYEKPEMEIIEFEAEDVITMSGGMSGPPPEIEPDNPDAAKW